MTEMLVSWVVSIIVGGRLQGWFWNPHTSLSKQARDPIQPLSLGCWVSKGNDGFSLLGSPRWQRNMHPYFACHVPQQQLWGPHSDWKLQGIAGGCGVSQKSPVCISQARWGVSMMSDLGMLCKKGMFPWNSTLTSRKQLFSSFCSVSFAGKN